MRTWIVYYGGMKITFYYLTQALDFAIEKNLDFDYFLNP